MGMETDGAAAIEPNTGESEGRGGDGDSTGAGDDGAADTGKTNGVTWIDSLSEDTRKLETLKKFNGKSLDDVVKAYARLEQTLTESGRKDAVIKPAADAPTHQWEEYYNKIGRPAQAGEYDLKIETDLPEGIKLSQAYETVLRDKMHKAGFTKEQARTVYQEIVNANIGLHKSSQVALAQKASDALDSVRTEFGASFDQRMKMVHQVMSRFLPESQRGKLTGKYTDMAAMTGNNPAMLQLLFNISQEFSEDSLRFPGQVDTKSAEDYRADLDAVNLQLTKMSPTDPKRDRLMLQAKEFSQKLVASRRR